MSIKIEIAYQLGKRGYKAGGDGFPMNDELFVQFVNDNEIPVVHAAISYIDGYTDADIKATGIVIDATNRFGAKND